MKGRAGIEARIAILKPFFVGESRRAKGFEHREHAAG